MGQVDDGGGIGLGLHLEPERVVVAQPIGDRGGQISWVTLLSIRAGIGHLHRGPVVGFGLAGHRPHLSIEALVSSVEVVFPVVFGQRVLPAVEREPGAGNAVDHPSADAAEVGMAGQVVLQFVETQGDVRHPALAVRNVHLGENRPVVGDPGFEALTVGQGVEEHRGLSHLSPFHLLHSGRLLLVTGAAGFRQAATESPGQKAQGHQGRCHVSVAFHHGFLRLIDGRDRSGGATAPKTGNRVLSCRPAAAADSLTPVSQRRACRSGTAAAGGCGLPASGRDPL